MNEHKLKKYLELMGGQFIEQIFETVVYRLRALPWRQSPLNRGPTGQRERGVWNQTDQGLSLGSAVSWLVTGLEQVL